jgi:adenylate cyclase
MPEAPAEARRKSRWSRLVRRFRAPLSIGGAVCLVSLTLYALAWLAPGTAPGLRLLRELEARTLDMRFRMRGPRKPSPAIVIVAIDQRSEDLLGRWPFPRSVFAQTLDFLHDANARVVAFDVAFPEPDENSALKTLVELKRSAAAAGIGRSNPQFTAQLDSMEAGADNDLKLTDAINRFGNTILGYFFLFDRAEAQSQDPKMLADFLNYLSFQAYPRVVRPRKGANFEGLEAVGISPDLPRLAEGAKNFGFYNVLPDSDGTVRSEPIVIRYQDNYYPSLDIATALAYTNESLDKVAVVFNENGLERVDLGNTSVPVDPEGMVRIDFHGPAGTYPSYSIADLVLHKANPEAFRDRIVLIGPTATGIADTRPTPFENIAFPGVEVHANFIDNLLAGSFIRRGLPENLIDMLFLIVFSLPVGVAVSVLRPLRSALVIPAVAALFLVFDQFAFSAHGIWYAAFLPVATLFTTYSLVVSYNFFFEEREKKAVRGAFQQYMAPEVISQVLDRPELLRLGGEEKHLTAMFSDIRGFTTLSEGLTPSGLVELLNEYFSEMTEVIFKNQGTLDKYIGDAIMAFWGAPLDVPDHAARACRAALEMSAALERLQERWRLQGRPRIDIGIGLNTGPMLVGNMGSQRRFNYTIMGDSVNLASRLEGVTKSFGTRVIISESTHAEVLEVATVRELDMIRVKGKTKPVTIYELLGTDDDRERFADLTGRFQEALQSYRDGSWSTALDRFQKLQHDYPNDGPTRTFVQRCSELIHEPPSDVWDGVYVMRSK